MSQKCLVYIIAVATLSWAELDTIENLDCQSTMLTVFYISGYRYLHCLWRSQFGCLKLVTKMHLYDDFICILFLIPVIVICSLTLWGYWVLQKEDLWKWVPVRMECMVIWDCLIANKKKINCTGIFFSGGGNTCPRHLFKTDTITN